MSSMVDGSGWRGIVGRRSSLLLVSGVVAVAAVSVAAILVLGRGPDARSAEAVATEALDGLAKADSAKLMAIANPDLSGRSAAVEALLTDCRGSDFSSARVAVRRGYGDDVAWADLSIPKGAAKCSEVSFALSPIKDTWYVAFGAASAPGPTASTAK
jgi:hypothetical protein